MTGHVCDAGSIWGVEFGAGEAGTNVSGRGIYTSLNLRFDLPAQGPPSSFGRTFQSPPQHPQTHLPLYAILASTVPPSPLPARRLRTPAWAGSLSRLVGGVRGKKWWRSRKSDAHSHRKQGQISHALTTTREEKKVETHLRSTEGLCLQAPRTSVEPRAAVRKDTSASVLLTEKGNAWRQR